MRRLAVFFPIALSLGAIILAPRAGAKAQDAREGPTEIEKCQTISKSGSYKLVNDLAFSGTSGVCLQITADFVTIDLAGFAINGPGPHGTAQTTAIGAGSEATGIAVRNGSISGFFDGVDLGGDGSIVEGSRVFGVGCPCDVGISARGIVKGNTVVGIAGLPGEGTGISATGIVTGNYATGSRVAEYVIGQGSTVIGNTAVSNPPPFTEQAGFFVSCPSNLTDNTATPLSQPGFFLNGDGCHSEDNVGQTLP
jgi:hypothetical protein